MRERKAQRRGKAGGKRERNLKVRAGTRDAEAERERQRGVRGEDK